MVLNGVTSTITTQGMIFESTGMFSSGEVASGQWLETKARQNQAEGCMCGCYPKEQLIRECCSVSYLLMSHTGRKAF